VLVAAFLAASVSLPSASVATPWTSRIGGQDTSYLVKLLRQREAARDAEELQALIQQSQHRPGALGAGTSAPAVSKSQPERARRAMVAKRSFEDLQCRGRYDRSIYSELERVCDDCYNLYKNLEVYGSCT